MSKSLYHNICGEKKFSLLYKKHAQELGAFLYYKYGSALNPTDKVQDAFIKLWENCEKIIPEKAKSFLYTVANNLMLNAVKHQRVVFKHQEIKPKDYTNESPEFMLRKKEFLQRYEKALSNLKEEERVAFMLNKIEGKTHKEVGEILGITKKVAEHRIYSAFKKLKNQLDDLK
ncbi:RNA polymerase sigma factor [Tenacibaculum sp. FZY0031]|uniref:RNA polymerase sigma factor n=1 Tax=Tenacibaculum sp. FZY0031 TaxID=3116648 RepID=UPI002EB650DA|nr:RNA polymerase sigma factor [Tenacibaculum sp. FZY0031]